MVKLIQALFGLLTHPGATVMISIPPIPTLECYKVVMLTMTPLSLIQLCFHNPKSEENASTIGIMSAACTHKIYLEVLMGDPDHPYTIPVLLDSSALLAMRAAPIRLATLLVVISAVDRQILLVMSITSTSMVTSTNLPTPAPRMLLLSNPPTNCLLSKFCFLVLRQMCPARHPIEEG
jgi:hypothetical protein